ncbi:MAG: hypothetical protein P1U86_09360 [Verrucomicrobiales bacterium]|nr:hypothetical protein [Verrucomicrobiales bacterium]
MFVLDDFLIGLASSAIVSAVAESRKQANEEQSKSILEHRKQLELRSEFTDLVKPFVDEAFSDFQLQVDLQSFLLNLEVESAIREKLAEQACELKWSDSAIVVAANLPEDFGLIEQFEDFIGRLVNATKRALSQNQDQFNEAASNALQNIQTGMADLKVVAEATNEGINDLKSDVSSLRKMLERQLPELPTPTGDVSQVPVSVIKDKYKSDYERLMDLLDQNQCGRVEEDATFLLQQIEGDQQYLEPKLKAGALTCRASARLFTGKIAEANEDFFAAFETEKVPATINNCILALIRRKEWNAAKEVFQEHGPEIKDSMTYSLIEADFLTYDGNIQDGFERVEKLAPQSPSDHFAIAEFYFFNQRYDKVEAHAREALEISKNSAIGKYFLGLGIGYPFVNSPSARFSTPEVAAKIEESIELLEAAGKDLSAKGEHIFLTFIAETLANLYVRLGKGDVGLNQLDEAIERNPDSQSLLDRKHRVLVFERRNEEAVQTARLLLEKEDSPRAHLREPWVYAMDDDFESAFQALNEAEKNCSTIREDSDYFVLFGVIHMNGSTKDLDLAIQTLTEGLETHQDNINLLIMRARAFKEIGDRDNTRRDLGAALALDPGEEDFREAARIYGSIRDWEEVDSIFSTRVPVTSGVDPCFDLAFDGAVFAENNAEAERMIDLIDESNPLIHQIRESEADFYARTGKFADADRILKALPTVSKRASNNLAVSFAKAGRHEKAFETLRPCLIAPNDPEFPLFAAKLKLELNENSDALLFLCSAYDLDPSHPETRSLFIQVANVKMEEGEILTFQEQWILAEINT